MSKYYDQCPICHQNFDDCPHSLNDIEERNKDLALRKIIRQEITRAKKRYEAPDGQV